MGELDQLLEGWLIVECAGRVSGVDYYESLDVFAIF